MCWGDIQGGHPRSGPPASPAKMETRFSDGPAGGDSARRAWTPGSGSCSRMWVEDSVLTVFPLVSRRLHASVCLALSTNAMHAVRTITRAVQPVPTASCENRFESFARALRSLCRPPARVLKLPVLAAGALLPAESNHGFPLARRPARRSRRHPHFRSPVLLLARSASSASSLSSNGSQECVQVHRLCGQTFRATGGSGWVLRGQRADRLCSLWVHRFRSPSFAMSRGCRREEGTARQAQQQLGCRCRRHAQRRQEFALQHHVPLR